MSGPKGGTAMRSIEKQPRTLYVIFTILISSILLLAIGCGGEDEYEILVYEIDMTPFIEMAKEADCADIVNRLYLIDGQLVFWDREGSCPDNWYSQTLFGDTVDDILCVLQDSIAGPQRSCQDDLYSEMFDTIIENIDMPDLGLGPGHIVKYIPFSWFSNFETTLSILNEDRDNIEVFQQGEPIILSFTFQNISGEIQAVQFTDYQQYDLQVYDSQDTLVWNWANDKVFPQALTELVFDVGETKVFEETWDQTSNEGVQVPVGIYNVYVNRFWNPDMSTGPEQIEIE
jgi:hypothetical protein